MDMTETSIPTFVKWAGGKKQLMDQFKAFFPKQIDRYFEPFVGGGAVAFYIIQNYHPKEVMISDINNELVNTYRVIKSNVDELIKSLKEHKEKHSENYYYQVRHLDPLHLSNIDRASRFIYLNKTCYNGLYRVNSNNQFNVPFGKYKNPAIFNETELKRISTVLDDFQIKCMSFEKVLYYAEEGDFIYFDPPYHPIKQGKSFTKYARRDFLEKEQEQLAQVFKKLNSKKCKVMLSNSSTEFIKNLYKDFHVHTVTARRMINCDANGRGKINEFVITNYPLNTKEV